MSREKKWTPGPWLRSGTLVYALNDRGTNRMSARVERGFIEDTKAPLSVASYEEIETVAVLMQSAPDLLEALEIASDYMHDLVDDAGCSSLETDKEIVRDAIAKAYGETE